MGTRNTIQINISREISTLVEALRRGAHIFAGGVGVSHIDHSRPCWRLTYLDDRDGGAVQVSKVFHESIRRRLGLPAPRGGQRRGDGGGSRLIYGQWRVVRHAPEGRCLGRYPRPSPELGDGRGSDRGLSTFLTLHSVWGHLPAEG